MRRFLYDTNVFVYALGAEHPYREPCRALVASQREELVRGEASIALVQEFCQQRWRQTRDRGRSAADAAGLAAALILHEVTRSDLTAALDLYAGHDRLDPLDAVYAAAALNRGIDVIVSADRAFEGVRGLERVDPLDVAAIRALGA